MVRGSLVIWPRLRRRILPFVTAVRPRRRQNAGVGIASASFEVWTCGRWQARPEPKHRSEGRASPLRRETTPQHSQAEHALERLAETAWRGRERDDRKLEDE